MHFFLLFVFLLYHFVINILLHFVYCVDVFIISKMFCGFPMCPLPVPTTPPPTLLPLYFPVNQSCACTSCDFVMWLLHGADDVVFAGQQKVKLFFF